MKAVYYETKGAAKQVLQLAQRALPEPQAGEVRVRIHVSAVNPSDTKARAGYRGQIAMPFAHITPGLLALAPSSPLCPNTRRCRYRITLILRPVPAWAYPP